MTEIAAQTFHVTATFSRRLEGKVDAAELIREFQDEWIEFMRGDEPSDDDVYEFVKECLTIMGLDFFLGDTPWASDVRQDDEVDSEVRG